MIQGRKTHAIAAKLLRLVLFPQCRLSKHDLDSLGDGWTQKTSGPGTSTEAIHYCIAKKCPGTMQQWFVLRVPVWLGLESHKLSLSFAEKEQDAILRKNDATDVGGKATSSQGGWHTMQKHNITKMVRLACVSCSRVHHGTMLGNRTESCSASNDWIAVCPNTHP
jgi:hypothetical protein